MKRYEIEILHSMRGRMRLKFPCGLDRPQKVFKFLSAKGGVYSFAYNPVIRTATIYYANYVTRDEILARAAVACVYGGKGGYVRICDKRHDKAPAIVASGQVALLMVIANIGVHLFLPMSIFATIMKWLTVGVTGYAIIEHGYKELNERGTFDPEVMSVVYLFDALNQGAYFAPAISWALTFARHLFQKNEGSITLRIEQDERDKKDYMVELVGNGQRGELEFLSEFSSCYLQAAPQLPFAGGKSGKLVFSSR